MKLGRVLGLTVILSAGCDPSGPGCDVCTTSALVVGRITDPDGAAVVNQQVDIRVYRDSCDEPLPAGGTDGGWPRTDEDGFYSGKVYSLFSPFVAHCLQIKVPARAAEDTAYGLAQVMTTLELRSDYRGPERDITRVDLVLSRKP